MALTNQTSTDKTLPKIVWPKQEATVLVLEKENPAAEPRVKRVRVSELKNWAFYGDEIHE